jgi:hypothetical protein
METERAGVSSAIGTPARNCGGAEPCGVAAPVGTGASYTLVKPTVSQLVGRIPDPGQYLSPRTTLGLAPHLAPQTVFWVMCLVPFTC